VIASVKTVSKRRIASGSTHRESAKGPGRDSEQPISRNLAQRDSASPEPGWRSVAQTAFTAIQGIIAEESLKPGDRLPGQRELSERLGASRTAVREALAMLETLGVVRIQPGIGVFVNKPREDQPLDIVTAWHFSDVSSAAEIYQVRFAIEGFAARMAARRGGAQGALELGKINESMRTALEEGECLAAASSDFEFHLAIIRLAGNRAMEQIIRTLHKKIFETQLMPLSAQARLFEAIDEHAGIIQAVKRGDAELAGVMMRYHITRSAERVGVAFSAG
jgi:GntR family transcriptional regulator, transcriptional repressor for pyruvate dehydrogenase complex